MPRKLRAFTTTMGFFDLAIAAPSMKAALEAWGSNQNLFKRGFAKETEDPAIVAATLAHPGVVLRRAVGTEGEFSENADLPKNLVTQTLKRVAKTRARPLRKGRFVARDQDATAQKAAILDFEKEKARREKNLAREQAKRRRAEAAEERDEKRRQIAVQKAEAILERARERHEKTVRRLEAQKNSIEDQLDAERQRWKGEEEKLDAKIREARR